MGLQQPGHLRRISVTLTLIVAAGTLSLSQAADNKGKKGNDAGKKPAAAAASKTNLPTQAERSKVTIAGVKPELHSAALAAAAKIDALIEERLQKEGLKPNPPATDEQFVRRAYLDITGTIPTSRQAQLFVSNTSPDKRTLLVDALLARSGYASQMYNWMADILRLVDKADNNTYLRPFSDWVKDSLRENRSWDSMVHEMLTAEGRIWGKPATGFVMRDAGMPLDNLNNAVRVFLGTRIGCAQCHDHPFDRWTQKEFYQLAALVGGMEYRPRFNQKVGVTRKDIDSLVKDKMSEGAKTARTILQFNRDAVWENNRKEIHYPHDYQYDNAKPDAIAEPAVLWGTPPASLGSIARRKALADWVASPTNPRFALTMANRLWQKALGYGLIEPVDDMKDDTKASHPEVLDFLASELVRLKFDLKELQRIIYFTKTWQRRAVYDDLDPEKSFLFAGPVLRRMTAEQAWDSLLTLTLLNPDALLRPDDKDFIKTVALDESSDAQDVLRRGKELAEIRKEERQDRSSRSYHGSELLRASELPQPLPEGHFLRQFGQSDRNVINDSHTDGTVPQLLTMFNGQVTHMMLEKGSVIYDEVVAEKGVSEQIDRIFLCLLARKPSPVEKNAALKEVRVDGNAGFGNVIWALLNTREFLFIQ